MNHRKPLSRLLSVGMCCAIAFCSALPASADDTMAHDPSRNVQAVGVGNPFNYGERNTPANASTAEIRAINHNMTVQEVKYSLFKEIDEHWDLLKLRLGETEREKVYALFLGVATRESTLGGNGDGSDMETAFSEGFGVSSAHAYGPMQTAVTAFKDCNPDFMQENDVPEMYQYSLSESTFYDCIISNHMGIRKILHFVNCSMTEDGQTGYQVVRAALKGFNTGWATYQPENPGYYKDYPDEIIALAHWYYDNDHLYDNVFTWTNAAVVDPYRGDPWGWWSDAQPSMAPYDPTVTTDPLPGDINEDQNQTIADLVLMQQYIVRRQELSEAQLTIADMDGNGVVNALDASLLHTVLLVK